jgi:dihydrofolate reductase
MPVKLIIAVDAGNAIGWSDGRLPWKIPYDMKRFKELTMNSTVVMGRTTYLSLGRRDGLPNRRNVVLTRRPYSEVREQFGNVEIISSLDWVEQHSEAQRRTVAGTPNEQSDIWIIGGASVYAEAIKRQMVDELHVTFVHVNSGADVTLPFDLVAWKLFILHERKLGIEWECVEHLRPTVVHPSPGIDIMVFRKNV